MATTSKQTHKVIKMFSRKSFPLLCLLFGIWWIKQVATDDDRPYLRILAPKFICNEKKGNQSASNNNLTISLQTREGQQLRYEIAIDFKMLSGFKSQQHTLSIWKNIRMLLKKFRKTSKDITQKNQVEIDAKELTSGVVYMFEIVGYDDGNRASEMQKFSITYKGGELKAQQPDIGDGVSLLLLSSEFFYDDMEFLAVADVAFCDPIADYIFKWEVVGFNSAEVETVIGNALWLPSNAFKPGKFLEVVVKLLNSESLTMASVRLPVKILSKDFQVQLAPAECLVGLYREIPFQALLSGQQNSAVTDAKWSCLKDNVECGANMNPSSSFLSQLITFPNEGSFVIQADFKIEEVTKSSSSKVTVDPRVISHIEIKTFPTQPVSVVQPNEFIVTVLNLIPKCFASWNIITDQGFAVLNDIESNFTDMGYIFIKDSQEYFLHELVDYDNTTLSKDVTLAIPGNALKPDESYKFRLTVTCPQPIVEGAPQASTENVISFFDIVVNTNGPPGTLPVVVKPLIGIGMKTQFKFSTGAAKDSTSNFPLRYTFGYIVNNLIVLIETFYENTVTHSQLPFSDSIETFCEVCDNNKACRRVTGPVVVVNTVTSFSDEQIEFKLKEFEATLRRAEFGKSFNLAVVFLLTQQKFIGDTSNYETRMLSMMKQEIEKLKSSDQTDMSQRKIKDFVKMSKNVMGLMTVVDEAFVKDILSLTELVKRSETRSRREASERNGKVLSHDPDYVKNVLSLSEILLKSNNATIVQQEKMKFVEKVHGFVIDMCNQNLGTQKMSSKSVSFEVSKIHSPQLSTEPLIMPDNSATLLFSSNANFPTKFVCVAKIKFIIDMFHQDTSEAPTSVFETMVMDDSTIGDSRLISVAGVSESVNVEIPSNDTSMTCLLWNGTIWSSDGCTKLKVNSTSKVGCKCKSSGFTSYIFKAGKAVVKPMNPQKITTKPVEETEIKVSSTSATMKDGTSIIPSSAVTVPTDGSIASGTKASEAIKDATTVQATLPAIVTTSNAAATSTALPTVTSALPNMASSLTTQQTLKEIVATVQTTVYLVSTSAAIKSTVSGTSEKSPLKTEPMQTTLSSTTIDASNNGTSTNVAKADLTSWGLIALLIIFFLVIIFLFFAHRCRKFVEQRMNLPMRTPANGIKYAKYHDEFIMQG